jgi:hypothetical protein
VSCAHLGDEGATGYIEIEKTKTKLGEAKANNKKINKQKKMKKKKQKPK